MLRLFIAIQFSEDIKDKVNEGIIRLRNQASCGNFTRRENLHLTLAFIGETDRVNAVGKAMNAVQADAFALTIQGMGQFRRMEGDIVWMGVELSDALCKLQMQLVDSLKKAGFSLDNRPFKPHVTLGRRVVLPDGWDSLPASVPSLTMPVDRISLMKSERIEGRLVYRELDCKELIPISITAVNK